MPAVSPATPRSDRPGTSPRSRRCRARPAAAGWTSRCPDEFRVPPSRGSYRDRGGPDARRLGGGPGRLERARGEPAHASAARAAGPARAAPDPARRRALAVRVRGGRGRPAPADPLDQRGGQRLRGPAAVPALPRHAAGLRPGSPGFRLLGALAPALHAAPDGGGDPRGGRRDPEPPRRLGDRRRGPVALVLVPGAGEP